MLCVHLPDAHLSPGSSSFCLYGNDFFSFSADSISVINSSVDL